MTGWLRRATAALVFAGGRADLWPAGALAALVYLGWLPLLLVVAPPNADDLQFFGVSLITSGSFPANVVALAMALVAGFMLLCLLAAIAELALLRSLSAGSALRAGTDSVRAFGGLAVILVGAVPAALAAGPLVAGLIAAAPGAFTSPDLATPVLLRLAGAVAPQIAVLLAALLLGQIFGGVALRFVLRDGGAADSMGEALRRLRRQPAGLFGVAVVAVAKDLVLVALTWALLRALWTPISDALGPGLLTRPATLLLLVGFVAVWLALLLIAGALHVAVSAWWRAELSPVDLSATRRRDAGAVPDALGGHG